MGLTPKPFLSLWLCAQFYFYVFTTLSRQVPGGAETVRQRPARHHGRRPPVLGGPKVRQGPKVVQPRHHPGPQHGRRVGGVLRVRAAAGDGGGADRRARTVRFLVGVLSRLESGVSSMWCCVSSFSADGRFEGIGVGRVMLPKADGRFFVGVCVQENWQLSCSVQQYVPASNAALSRGIASNTLQVARKTHASYP